MEDRIGQRCLKKLNLNIPPLSVRRQGGFSNAFEPYSIDAPQHQPRSGDRVPFSWEQAPGKPKAESDQSLYNVLSSNCAASASAETQTPRPKPPPGRQWHRDNTIVMIQEPHAATGAGSSQVSGTGSWCSVDGRDCYCCSNLNSSNNSSSDAVVETLSLSEAIDVLEKSDRVHELDASKLKMVEAAGNLSPGFIMNRFLPDANALAVESFCWNINTTKINHDSPLSKVVVKPRPTSVSPWKSTCIDNNNVTTDADDEQRRNMKVCGLQNLFSWRIKHRICGVNKSPVLRVRPP